MPYRVGKAESGNVTDPFLLSKQGCSGKALRVHPRADIVHGFGVRDSRVRQLDAQVLDC